MARTAAAAAVIAGFGLDERAQARHGRTIRVTLTHDVGVAAAAVLLEG